MPWTLWSAISRVLGDWVWRPEEAQACNATTLGTAETSANTRDVQPARREAAVFPQLRVREAPASTCVVENAWRSLDTEYVPNTCLFGALSASGAEDARFSAVGRSEAAALLCTGSAYGDNRVLKPDETKDSIEGDNHESSKRFAVPARIPVSSVFAVHSRRPGLGANSTDDVGYRDMSAGTLVHENLSRSRRRESAAERERLLRRLARLESSVPPAVSYAREPAFRTETTTSASRTSSPAVLRQEYPDARSRDVDRASPDTSLVRLRASAALLSSYLDYTRRLGTQKHDERSRSEAQAHTQSPESEAQVVEIIDISDDESTVDERDLAAAAATAAAAAHERWNTSADPSRRMHVMIPDKGNKALHRTESENLIAGPVRAEIISTLQKCSSLTSPVTDVAHRVLEIAWNSGLDVREPLVSHEGFKLTRSDLLRLRPGGWLNDAILNAYCQGLLMERQTREGTRRQWPRCAIFSTFFYTRLCNSDRLGDAYDYNGVRRWTRSVNVFELDRVLVPINLSNTHWTLALIEPHSRKLTYYDSMGGTGKGVLQTLRRWLCDEAMDKLQLRIDEQAWTLTVPKSVPLQTNGNDCGVFVAAFAEHLTRTATVAFSASMIPHFRMRMCVEILCGYVPP